MTYAEYLGSQGLSKNTIATYCVLISKALRECQTKTLEEFFASIPNPDTRRSFFFAFRKYEDFTGKRVLGAIKPPPQNRAVPHCLKHAEMQKLLNVGALKESSVSMQALVYLIFATGLRISEAIAVKITDIDEENQTIRVFGKGSKERLVVMGPEALRVMRAYWAMRANISEYAITTVKGTPYNRGCAASALKYWARKVGVKLHPHMLRHTFATEMLNNGADLETIRQQLGHENLQATQVYVHVSIEQRKKVYSRSNPLQSFSLNA